MLLEFRIYGINIFKRIFLYISSIYIFRGFLVLFILIISTDKLTTDEHLFLRHMTN